MGYNSAKHCGSQHCFSWYPLASPPPPKHLFLKLKGQSYISLMSLELDMLQKILEGMSFGSTERTYSEAVASMIGILGLETTFYD